MREREQEPPERSPIDTDLERRVLAHERVLQALIAYMSRSEPRFIEHLRKIFVEPMTMERHEQDYRGADDYAEEFIRAIVVTSGDRASARNAVQAPEPIQTGGEKDEVPVARERANSIAVTERNGIWCVKIGEKSLGEFVRKEHALAEAALLKLAMGR